jgi:hypothetical protein
MVAADHPRAVLWPQVLWRLASGRSADLQNYAVATPEGIGGRRRPSCRCEGPNVWSDRALQEGFVDLAALRSCINVSGLSPPCGKVLSNSPPARSRWLATSPSCRRPDTTSGAGYRRFRRPPPPPRTGPSRRRNPLFSHPWRRSSPRRPNPPLRHQRRRPRPRSRNRHRDRRYRCAERYIGFQDVGPSIVIVLLMSPSWRTDPKFVAAQRCVCCQREPDIGWLRPVPPLLTRIRPSAGCRERDSLQTHQEHLPP